MMHQYEQCRSDQQEFQGVDCIFDVSYVITTNTAWAPPERKKKRGRGVEDGYSALILLSQSF